MSGHGDDWEMGGRVPDLHRAVVASSCQSAPIGTEGDRAYRTSVDGDSDDLCVVSKIPEGNASLSIGGSGGNRTTVGTEGDPVHRADQTGTINKVLDLS